ncbi:hypothetical protein GGF32_002876 [Allomyces javanicus]|nr:hypothetical protein GGF32_002876 [Allomyces javanicus]
MTRIIGRATDSTSQATRAPALAAARQCAVANLAYAQAAHEHEMDTIEQLCATGHKIAHKLIDKATTLPPWRRARRIGSGRRASQSSIIAHRKLLRVLCECDLRDNLVLAARFRLIVDKLDASNPPPVPDVLHELEMPVADSRGEGAVTEVRRRTWSAAAARLDAGGEGAAKVATTTRRVA